jgi:hypothetical protein
MQPTDLLGYWRLERTVMDRRAGSTGTVIGTTSLSVEDGDDGVGHVVRWDESGEMEFDRRTVPVTRTLRVLRSADGSWTVHFADGRVFHPWVWGETVEHACSPDDYTGLLAGDASRWTVRWDAVGPAKDYRLDSVLTR